MDLGTTYDYPEPIGGGIVKSAEPKKHYPTAHLETEKELDLPDEGTITFKFKKKSSEWRKNDDGKEKYSCSLELREIVKTRKKNSEKCCEGEEMPHEATEKALDAIVISIGTASE